MKRSSNENQSIKTAEEIMKQKEMKKRHIPHAMQPPHKVSWRNSRERTRIHAVNDEFARLRRLLPYEKKTRVPKEDIIRLAVIYIKELRSMVVEHDAQCCNGTQCTHHKENITTGSQCTHEKSELTGTSAARSVEDDQHSAEVGLMLHCFYQASS